MDQPPKKKPYITPQLFRVELNQEQAILSSCSLTTASAAGNAAASCRPAGRCEPPGSPGGCKRSSYGGACGDVGPRAS
jgi:hypothetical protein